MKARTLCAALGAAVIALGMTMSAWAASIGEITVGLEPSFFAGTYGTSHMVRIYDLPMTVSYRSGPVRLHVEIPYIAISGSGIVIGGTAVSTGHPAGLRTGLGDIWLQAEYRLSEPRGLLPSVEPYAKLKIPTASFSNGLGTGRPDEEVGGRFGWIVRQRVFPFIRVGYRVVGKEPSLHLQDIFTFAPGITFVPVPRNYLTLLLIGHTAIQAGGPPMVSLVLAYNRRINRRWGFQTYLAHGLTAGSAAIGVGIGALAHF